MVVEARENWLPMPERNDIGSTISTPLVVSPRPKLVWSVNALLTLLCLSAGGVGGWYSHAFLWRPSFVNARALMVKYHMPAAAERLEEAGHICPDEAKAPLSCVLLLTRHIQPEVALATLQTETEAD
jgi:hypothetical protein